MAIVLALGLCSCLAAGQQPRPSAEAQAAGRADRALVQAIRQQAVPLRGADQDYAVLFARLKDKRFVLLGEDTHGTQEIYEQRAYLTRRLVREHDFDALLIESDFTPVERLNAYVLGEAGDADAAAALADHQRFPDWMWANVPFRDLIEWLREFNRATGRRVQVAGLDLHGLPAAVDALRRQLTRLAPAIGEAFEARLACLAAHDYLPDRYRAAINAQGQSASCAADTAATAQFVESWLEAPAQSSLSPDLQFRLRRNLALIVASEAYSRVQVSSGSEAWNLRDRYMAVTAAAIAAAIESNLGRPAKLVLWAHNTHVADARGTDRGPRSGYLSLGQIVRETHPTETYVLGFTTRLGTVRAAGNWGETDRPMPLRRPAWESVSALFGRVRMPSFLLPLDAGNAGLAPLGANVAMRAIGVVYWPHAERREHYFRGNLPAMFDAIIHIDQSRALEPLPLR